MKGSDLDLRLYHQRAAYDGREADLPQHRFRCHSEPRQDRDGDRPLRLELFIDPTSARISLSRGIGLPCESCLAKPSSSGAPSRALSRPYATGSGADGPTGQRHPRLKRSQGKVPQFAIFAQGMGAHEFIEFDLRRGVDTPWLAMASAR